MEVLVAVIAFAGSLLAAVATAALVGRFRSEPTGWAIAWSLTTAALCVSLGVIGAGHLLGFGAATFRAYQLTGSLLAPLWLAVGVVQLLTRGAGLRFASWLVGAGFTIVGAVILAVDRVEEEKSFGKSLPVGSVHWGLPPTYVLLAVHVVAALVLVAGVAVAVRRWRGGDEYDADNMHALLVLGPTGLALVGAMSFAVPGMFTALLLCVAAAAIWYGLLRPLAPYEDDDEDEDEGGYDAPAGGSGGREPAGRRAALGRTAADVPVVGRTAADVPVAGMRALAEEPPRRSGLGDLVAEYRAGEPEPEGGGRRRRSAQPRPAGDDPFGGPATGMFMAGEYGMPPGAGGYDPQAGPHDGQAGSTGEYDIPLNEYGRRPAGPSTGEFAVSDSPLRPMAADQAFGAPQARHGRPDASSPGLPGVPGGHGRAAGPPETGAVYSGAAAGRPGRTVRPSPNVFGLLTVFTLIDGTGEMFDRLAEETVEAVRGAEPDTLIYACHAVKSAPLQRIVYEIYRDEVAYAEHQRQPHVERFVSERQNMVLATNVIDLRVNAAKVLPLPTSF
ncbi:antibiotic biosynthesis monooxygenase [Streptosporangium sp. NPDC048047]|uniref:antibiotic biosynthesis monooxygenase n=1 Tax=Streptosporangium sp. NPDC048047 TaxID=3155748 RepID=UPI0034141E3A